MASDHFFSVRDRKTYCRIVGDISMRPPVVVVHGGPGFSWDYLEPLDMLHARYDIPLVYYDQSGSGRSTPGGAVLPRPSLEEFSTQLRDVLSELNVGNGYILMGHSAGAMIALEHACESPKGLRGLILGNAFASIELFMQDVWRLRRSLPLEISGVLDHGEQSGLTTTPEYSIAMSSFFENFVCRRQPIPEALLKTLRSCANNPAIFETLWGKSVFHLTGSYKGWSAISRLGQIEVPTLAYRGEHDDAGVKSSAPFSSIQNVRLATIGNASHVPHLEDPELTIQLIAEFITSRCH